MGAGMWVHGRGFLILPAAQQALLIAGHCPWCVVWWRQGAWGYRQRWEQLLISQGSAQWKQKDKGREEEERACDVMCQLGN